MPSQVVKLMQVKKAIQEDRGHYDTNITDLLTRLLFENPTFVDWGKVNDALNKRSFDAAEELFKHKLPNWRARIDIGKRYRCWVISPNNEKTDAYSSSPARAMTLSMVVALLEMEMANG